MEYKKEINVICLGDPKQSALYFDQIVPISLLVELYGLPQLLDKTQTVIEHFGLSEKDIANLPIEACNYLLKDCPELVGYSKVVESLISTDNEAAVKGLSAYIEYFMRTFFLTALFAELYRRDHSSLKKYIPEDLPKHILQLLDSISKKFDKSIYSGLFRELLDLFCCFYIEGDRFKGMNRSFKDDFDSLPPVKSGKKKIILPSSCFDYYDAKEEDLTISLANLNLVETKKTEWTQIIEFRKDKEARRKLRNLRLFLVENYEGRSISFIEDDLGKRLDDYQNTCKDWGFETLTSSISTLIDEKNLIGLLAGSTCATIFGGPTVGIVTGTLIELAGIAITFARRKYAFHKLKRDHDLAYLIEAKERISNS